MSSAQKKKGSPIRFLFENSGFLIGGAAAALVWANLDQESYLKFIEHEIWGGPTATGAAAEGAAAHNTVQFVINDILMAFFFAIAAKEVWESLLPGGALSSPRKAATPLLATLGGMAGPAGLYLLGVYLFDDTEGRLLSRGWAIPCATDIAFSYLVARIVFGPGHPAIAFLLLLAIADDAGGLIILAVFYPSHPVEPVWLLLTVAAIALGFGMRKLRLHSFWWYIIVPGALSWFSFLEAGLHPALGLVPIIPTLPHAHTDLGVFAIKERRRHDTLNEFEHWWKNPVELVLGLFGLANAGVKFESVGLATYLVLVGLIAGKPLGVFLFSFLAEKGFKLEIPKGMGYREIVVVGMIAGIGFTVSLFVSVAAFPVGQPPKFPQEILDAAKMGALGSFASAILAIVAAFLLGIRPLREGESGRDDGDSSDGD